MDAILGTDCEAAAPALPDLPLPHPTLRRARMRRAWIDSVLVGAVLALGLLQGARAALGGFALDVEPAAPLASPAAALAEEDALRGRFYRPPGSDAVRPPLRLEPLHWQPSSQARIALVCETGC